MKKIIVTLTALFFIGLLNAQTPGLAPILKGYLNIKDALVKSDAATAAQSAIELSLAINKTQVNELWVIEKKMFEETKENLLKNCEIINKTTDIEKQRTAFLELSITMWTLVKQAESITETIYYDYCPMNDVFWLSTEEEIKNPYYGSKMISCGNVSDKKN